MTRIFVGFCMLNPTYGLLFYKKKQIMEQTNIVYCDKQFTVPLPTGGYRWTLASLLGDMIYEAEKLFGERDYSYTILGVELVYDGPRVWYPGSRKQIIIQLSLEAATNMFEACYQMAQETIHLLAPTGGPNANNFEEGVSLYFAELYMRERLNAEFPLPSMLSYKTVLDVVRPLLDADRYCVRKLRSQQPSFSKMTKGQLKDVFPYLSADDISFLLQKFDRDSECGR